MSYILVGGTFDSLHKGHRKMIEKAFSLGGKVLVCLTSDEMVKDKHLSWHIDTYEKRKSKLKDFLMSKKWLSEAEIVKIENPFSEGLRPGLTHIVISEETRGNAEKINRMRSENRLAPLEIIEIEWELAEDGKTVSDMRIRKGDIDREGCVTSQ
ncbi:MAG: pantetheine-phosphate adenylyltransferase [Candidatus Aenigmarchaeota archaeon]|nr:pantetheine-phosphate adenylyltransferase [Candidatus Aenigmarchaeota archaeon]